MAGEPFAGIEVIPQRGDGLDERLACAFTDADDGRPVVLIGMDTPQVTPALLHRALMAVGGSAHGESAYDAVFGPAADGGFWLLGLRAPAMAADLVPGVPMSRGDTGLRQLRRLTAAGLRTCLLPELTDVDTAADAAAVAACAPYGRFARALGVLTHSSPVSV